MSAIAASPIVFRPARLRRPSPSTVLFMSVFTSQAAILVLSPILVDVAHELNVSTAVAGQLRIFAAPVAALVALLLARFGNRAPLRSILLGSAVFVAAGSVASAVAPSFLLLALAQLPLWIGVAGLVAAGIGAAAAWSTPELRPKVVARALAGAPAAWVVGMPLIGLVSGTSWRLAFIAVPLPAALIAGALILGTDSPEGSRAEASVVALLKRPGARRWALAEFLAMSAWTGTLVFSGALFVETYGTSPQTTGILLAVIAVAYLAGNALGPRIRGACRSKRALAQANVVAALALAAMWTVTPNVVVTLAFFSSAAVVVALRTVVGTTYGFTLAGERQLEVGAARAAMTHIGYLSGSLFGGAAFALWGSSGLGVVFGAMFVAAALPYATVSAARCTPPEIAAVPT